jgi:ribosome-associated heat shock protein Hsp15
METKNDKVRLDKWLWAARFFKTRPLAAEAVSGGKVHINGNRAKPAHGVNIGDEMHIRKGPYEFIVTVTGLSARRGPAKAAALLYEETPASREARALLSEQHRLVRIASPRHEGRPNKRQRRQIIRFTGKGTG